MTTIEDVLREYIFTIILIIGETFVPNYRIRDVKTIGDVIEKYTQELKSEFKDILDKWQKKNLNKLLQKMINSTLEEIKKNREDEDFQDVFFIMNCIIEKNIHYKILNDLGENVDQIVKNDIEKA